jgi:hypothetical protein
MSNSYGSQSSSSRNPVPMASVDPVYAADTPDYVFRPQYENLLFVPELGMSVDTVTRQLWIQYSPHLAFPQPFVFIEGVVYDRPFAPAPLQHHYGASRPPVPLFVPSQQEYAAPAPTFGSSRPSVVITRPPVTAMTNVTEEAADQFLNKPLPEMVLEEEEDDTIVELPSTLAKEDLLCDTPFGVLDYHSLLMKCAEHLAVALGSEVQVAHLSLASDRSSVCTVYYDRKIYIVDTYKGIVYTTLPSDFDTVGRVVLAREKIGTIDNRLTYEGKIVVSHVLNARDECFEMKDILEENGIRLGLFHYLKSDKGKVDPTGKSSTVRGTLVDLTLGVPICGSYGWTPVSRNKSALTPTKDGKIILRSDDETGLSVENVFNVKDLNVTPGMVDGDAVNGLTIMPFIEGPLIRAVLSYGFLRILSHSSLNLQKSVYRGSETFEIIFFKYGLTRDVLFPGNYQHSNFHYNFILRDDAFLGSSRAPVGVGSLAYLGVTYNYSSDPDYCPYDHRDVLSQPIEFKVGSTVGRLSRKITSSAAAAASSEDPCIFVPRKMTIKEANAHLAREFGVLTDDSEGSVIIMQKDASNLYTNIVRAIHPNAANRLDFIEGANDMEAFLKHVPDSYAEFSHESFRNRYSSTFTLLFPKGNIQATAPQKGKSAAKKDDFNFARYAKMLGESIYKKIGSVGHPNTIYLNDALALHGSIGLRDYNNVPKPRDRLYIIAITYIMSLPPARQALNYDIIDRYDAFIRKANEVFEAERAFINTHGSKKGEPLFSLKSKLQRREKKPDTGKKIPRGAVSTVQYPARINLSRLNSADLVDYYRGYNKIFTVKNSVAIREARQASQPPLDIMDQFSSSSSSSSAEPEERTASSRAPSTKKKIFRKKNPNL